MVWILSKFTEEKINISALLMSSGAFNHISQPSVISIYTFLCRERICTAAVNINCLCGLSLPQIHLEDDFCFTYHRNIREIPFWQRGQFFINHTFCQKLAQRIQFMHVGIKINEAEIVLLLHSPSCRNGLFCPTEDG